MTEILPAESHQAIRLARRLLREGEVIAFPTDTVYGVGTNAFQAWSVRRVFALKQRPPDKALPVFIYQVDDLNQVARNVPNRAWLLLQKLWPGPLTVVLPKNPHLPAAVTGGQDTIAVRIPNHPLCLELVVGFGRPLAVTSANLSGRPTPPTAQGVAAQLGPGLPLVLDGGPSPTSRPSTVIDLSVDPPRLLRQGDLEPEILREYLPTLQLPPQS